MASRTKWLGLLALVILTSCREAEAIASCDASDSAALLEFSSAFNDYGKVLISWQPNTDCCSWSGVNCSALTGRVQGLEILGPDVKTGLPLIRKVDFGGAVGASLGRLMALQYLRLTDVYFNTLAPWPIGQLWPTLTELTLVRCNFSGGIPFTWGYLSNVKTIVLSSSFAGGIPGELCNLPSVVIFDVSDNLLTGPFPSCLMNLKTVQVIRFDNNQLSGPLPIEVGMLSPTLTTLSLANNKITGLLPIALTKLTGLRVLSLDRNFLTGQIPSELSLMKSLVALSLSHNPFGGLIPPALANLPKLSKLDLTNCSLVGPIPSTFGNLVSLTLFEASNNNLTGSFPASFGYIPAVNRVEIDVGYNKLTGDLPDTFYTVMTFNASHNSFTGNFPLSLAGAKFVDISSNKLTGLTGGVIPDNVSPLQYLKLDKNNISTSIPRWFGSLNGLNYIEVSDNQFYGGLPPAFLALPSLNFVNFSDNQLTGELGSFPSRSLVVLDLHRNHFTGAIPDDYITNIPYLKYLDLSYNMLTRTVPANLFQSGLAFLSLAGNKLCSCGEIPSIP